MKTLAYLLATYYFILLLLLIFTGKVDKFNAGVGLFFTALFFLEQAKETK